MSQVVKDTLKAGREAAERHAWREAFEHLAEADRDVRLSSEDLETLAEAAWWSGRLEECIEARERAYGLYVEQGNRLRAAAMAMELRSDYGSKLAPAVAGGWKKRAERLLAEEPESVEHGYLSLQHSGEAFGRGDLDEAYRLGKEVESIAAGFGDRDLMALGVFQQGDALLRQGKVEEGLALIDEASAAAVGGELGPNATAAIYCWTISACRDLGDIRRAGDWTDAAKRWCERQAIAGFPGICRVYRAEIMRMRGAWAEAEQEARRASDELRDFNLLAAGGAFHEIGEVRLLAGDLAGAEDAFRQAHELGHDPQPGLALLRLAEGRAKAAAKSLERALADATEDPFLGRARLLPAQVEIALTARDINRARLATEELEGIARSFKSPALEASASYCRGALALAQGESAAAVTPLRSAWSAWRELSCPYEAARARMLLGSAFAAMGDREAAVMELEAARVAFDGLGAAPDARRASSVLREQGEDVLPGGAREAAPASRTFMFTDIVKSTDLVELIGDRAWQNLLDWHDRTLRTLFAKHRGEEIDHTGDGFFVAFGEAGSAIECAVAIQRRLAEQRQTQGFSPQVRIGLHAAEAAQRGRNYAGKGVHTARRIASLAAGEEIVASVKTADAASTAFPISEPRGVRVKGIRDEIRVVGVEWR